MKKLHFILLLCKSLFFLGAVSSCLYSALCKVEQVFIVFSPERKLHSVAEPLRFIVLIICCVFISTCNDKIDNKASQKRILLTVSVEKFKQKLDTKDKKRTRKGKYHRIEVD